jgi:segregation and condensation protein B
MTLDQKIEGVLFYKASPIKKQALCELLDVTIEELEAGITVLQERLKDAGTALVATESELELGTAPILDDLIESIRKDEIRRDIGKAGAETLAIVLYRGPVSRSEIDRIRGVNSSYILRNLMIRGLIERAEGKRAEFSPTTELLRHLGINDKTKLRDYSSVMTALENYEKNQIETKPEVEDNV